MVAGISGYAVAGGLELALLCDLRVVEDTAVMGFYGRRFGKFYLVDLCALKSLSVKFEIVSRLADHVQFQGG